MKKIISILCLTLLAVTVQAQLNLLQNDRNPGSPLTANYPGVAGLPFTSDFQRGSITFDDGFVLDCQLRYNAYSNSVEYKLSGNIFFASASQVESFYILNGAEKRVFKKKDRLAETADKFYEELNTANGLTLAKVYNVALGTDMNAPTYGSVMGKAFLHSEAVYLCYKDKCVLLKNNKVIKNLFDDALVAKAEEVVRTNRLNLKKEDDAISFVELMK